MFPEMQWLCNKIDRRNESEEKTIDQTTLTTIIFIFLKKGYVK